MGQHFILMHYPTVSEESFIPNYPISVDVKITDKCSHGCLFCYEDSGVEGKNGNEAYIELLKQLPSSTEIAIGGGNPIESDLLIKILNANLKCSISFTINQKDIDKVFTLEEKEVDCSFIEKKSEYLEHFVTNPAYSKAKAIGISVTEVNDEFLRKVKFLSNSCHRTMIVWHIIAGVLEYSDIKRLIEASVKCRILILGFKNKGRGKSFLKNNSKVKYNQSILKRNIDKIRNMASVVAFDNLAIEQLDVKKAVTSKEWNQYFLGQEGEYTMFLDMVNGSFRPSSNSHICFEIGNKNFEDI